MLLFGDQPAAGCCGNVGAVLLSTTTKSISLDDQTPYIRQRYITALAVSYSRRFGSS